MKNFLIEMLNNVVPLSAEENEKIASLFTEKQVKKGEFFLQQGQVHTQLGFIVKGLMRYFVYKNGEESTLEFSAEGIFITEYESFTTSSRAIQNIQAIEDTTLLVTDYKGLMYIYEQIPSGNKLGRIIIENRFNTLMRQLLSIYMHNPEERYLHFINTYPDLIQRVPQYYIASYVGVKPPSLSRIRRRLAGKLS